MHLLACLLVLGLFLHAWLWQTPLCSGVALPHVLLLPWGSLLPHQSRLWSDLLCHEPYERAGREQRCCCALPASSV